MKRYFTAAKQSSRQRKASYLCSFTPMGFLTVSGISVKIDPGFEVNDISFSQKPSQKIAIAGETGSGKSTVLKIIAGLIQPDRGTVFFEGERIKGPYEKLIPGHPGIAYLSQHFELRKSYRIEEELEYLNRLEDDVAEEIFRVCDISHLLKRKTSQVSGGERQRIALARQLVSSPRLLLLDEPFSNLDHIHKTKLKSVLAGVSRRLNISSMLVSHDPAEILSWADTVLVMQNGRLITSGTPHALYTKPENEYIAGLLGKYSLVPPSELLHLNNATQEQKIFLRPEQLGFCPVADSDFTYPATVKNISFLGNGYETEADCNGTAITVYSGHNNFKPGDHIGLSILSKELWYL